MFSRRSLSILATASVAIALVFVAYPSRSAAQTLFSPGPIVTPYRASGIYPLGEKAGWTIRLPQGLNGKVAYRLKTNNHEVIQSGEIDSNSGRGTVEATLKAPAMLYLELTPPGRNRPLTYGAAIAPTQLQPVAPRPRDFDSFWNAKIAALKAVPENPLLKPGESNKPEVEYATIQMDHVNGTHVYGQIAKPKRPGKYPALLILQWASPPYPLDRSWVIERAAEGWLALNVEPHDVLPTEPRAYYSALPAALKNYQTIGQDDRDRSYFVEMYLRDYRAVDYLAKCTDWDGKTLVVMGTSMGGQQSLAVAGLHPKISHLIVNEPAGCDLNAALHGRQAGYPFFPSNDPKVMEAARYVDAINFASRIKATSLVAIGFTDDVAPPAGIWTAFNLIRGPKEAVPMYDSPHNNLATPEQQRPYTTRSAAWLNTLVRGQNVVPRRLDKE